MNVIKELLKILSSSFVVKFTTIVFFMFWSNTSVVYAEVYKCLVNGQTSYSSKPCSPKSKKMKIKTLTKSSVKTKATSSSAYRKCKDALTDKEIKKMTTSGKEAAAHAYSDLIRAHSKQLEAIPRKLRRPKNYICPLNNLTSLALKSTKVAEYRKSFLMEIESDYPAVYPYLILHSQPLAPFISKEQDEVVGKVARKEIVPHSISRFMKKAGVLFEVEIRKGNIRAAKRYVEHLIEYYGVSDETAMDFAFLYNRMGDTSNANQFLEKFGKKYFKVSNFDLKTADGNYSFKGFGKRGRLKFENMNSKNVFISYQPRIGTYELGIIPGKWNLHFTKRRYHGSNNSKYPNSFAFDNGGAIKGDMVWTSVKKNQSENKKNIKSKLDSGKTLLKDTADNIVIVEIPIIKKDIKKTTKNNIEDLFLDGFHIDEKNGLAIKGNPLAAPSGPLLDDYFPASFSQNRRIGVVKEKLFKKGYIDVSGIPMFDKWYDVPDMLKKDFPQYSYSEKKDLAKALKTAKMVNSSGQAQIYQNKNKVWELTETLLPDDAMLERHFGINTAVYNNKALVCDIKQGLYSFKKAGDKWLQQQKMETPCKSVVMYKNLAAVGAREKVYIFKNIAGAWGKIQTLVPKDLLLKKDKRQKFRRFGSSLAMSEDSLFIGNEEGGAEHKGEVYVFNLLHNKWKQSQILSSKKSKGFFGKSIAATKGMLVVGSPSMGNQEATWLSGAAFIYVKNKSKWKVRQQLVPKGKPSQMHLGEQVLIKKDKTLLLKGRYEKTMFSYSLKNI